MADNAEQMSIAIRHHALRLVAQQVGVQPERAAPVQERLDAFDAGRWRAPADRDALVAELQRINTSPAEVDFFTKDPVAFWETMRARFAEQRKAQPDRPYGFAVPELAGTTRFLRMLVAERLSHYGFGGKRVWRTSDAIKHKAYRMLGMNKLDAHLQKDARAETLLLKAIGAALDHLNPTHPPYDELVRLTFFATRALALTSDEKSKQGLLRNFALDTALETKLGTPQEELKRFTAGARAFDTQALRNAVSKRAVFGHFAEVFDPAEMRSFVLPIPGVLQNEHFTHFRHVPVHFSSLLFGQIEADGFRMNEHQFGTHDITFHGLQKDVVDREFDARYAMTESLKVQLRERQEKWTRALTQELQTIADPKKRAAVTLMTAYVLHNRPKPYFPTSFTDWTDVMLLSRFKLKAAGQLRDDGISNGIVDNVTHMKWAIKWLRDFWSRPEVAEDPLVQEILARDTKRQT